MDMVKIMTVVAEICTPGSGAAAAYTYHNVPTFAFTLGKILLRIVLIGLIVCGIGYLVGRFSNRNGLAEDFKLWGRNIILAMLHLVLLWIGLSMVLGYVDSSVIDVVFGGIVLAGFLIAVWSRFSEGVGASSLLMAVYIMILIMGIWAFIAPKIAPNLPSDFIPKFFYDALYPGSPYCG